MGEESSALARARAELRAREEDLIAVVMQGRDGPYLEGHRASVREARDQVRLEEIAMQDTSFIFCQMALHLNVGLEPGSDAARIFSVDRNVYSGCYVSSTSDLMQEDLREWFSGKPERLVHALSGLEFTIGPFKV